MNETMAAQFLFALYSLIIAAGGFLAVSAASLVRSMVGLIAALFGTAGLYLLMNAPFMALMQILIYVGAVAVLIFFAIMLTRGEDGEGSTSALGRLVIVGASLLLPLLLGLVLLKTDVVTLPAPELVDIAILGKKLLGEYVLAFELISVVLFVAMAGAVVLGFERRDAR